MPLVHMVLTGHVWRLDCVLFSRLTSGVILLFNGHCRPAYVDILLDALNLNFKQPE